MSGWQDSDRERLTQLHDSEVTAQAALRAQVAWCRQAGMPWQLIADALGVSRQAAHRRFRSTRVALADQELPTPSDPTP